VVLLASVGPHIKIESEMRSSMEALIKETPSVVCIVVAFSLATTEPTVIHGRYDSECGHSFDPGPQISSDISAWNIHWLLI